MSARGFDFSEPAELYGGRTVGGRGASISYRRFETAADAIRYAVEELSGALGRASVLEVGGNRFGHMEIRRLYDSSAYPLPRRGEAD